MHRPVLTLFSVLALAASLSAMGCGGQEEIASMCIYARVPNGTDYGTCNGEDSSWVGPAGVGFGRTAATAERAAGWIFLSMTRDGVSNDFVVEVYWTDYEGAGQAPRESRIELARREYDEEFVASGRTDSFPVTFDNVEYTIEVARNAS